MYVGMVIMWQSLMDLLTGGDRDSGECQGEGRCWRLEGCKSGWISPWRFRGPEDVNMAGSGAVSNVHVGVRVNAEVGASG